MHRINNQTIYVFMYIHPPYDGTGFTNSWPKVYLFTRNFYTKKYHIYLYFYKKIHHLYINTDLHRKLLTQIPCDYAKISTQKY